MNRVCLVGRFDAARLECLTYDVCEAKSSKISIGELVVAESRVHRTFISRVLNSWGNGNILQQ